LPIETQDSLEVEECRFLFTNSLLIFDHVKHRMQVLCNAIVEDDPGAAYDAAAHTIDCLIQKLRAPEHICPSKPHPGPPDVTPNMERQQFEDAVARCNEYIMAGDAFQVVPSQRFTVKLRCAPFEVYRALRSVNPSPYM